MTNGDRQKLYVEMLTDLRREKARLEQVITYIEEKLKTQQTELPLRVPGMREEGILTSPLSGMSMIRAAIAVLKEKGQPMPTADIFEELQKRGFPFGGKNPKGALFTGLTRSKEVKKASRGVWELRE